MLSFLTIFQISVLLSIALRGKMNKREMFQETVIHF